MLLQETARRHRVGERQIRPLHGNGPIEVSIRPDVHNVGGNKGNEKKSGHRFCVAPPPGQTAKFLPAPGGKQHLNEQDNRHADKHQLPVTRRLILVGVNYQFPDDGIEMQVKTGKNFAIDK
ncbi:hypothetical protein COLO4_02170 [Corchorus olitorius]|uniref:Uncharacterized protein n=1 Tax=Corchorus olitorius TaxID=93759 RepID=A0A1R3L1C9_9ROSI|nr:hypothetical protein COLO4_02170 [Corchorus olitorius]